MEISKVIVDKNLSIKKTMATIDQNGLGLAFVVDKKKIFGVVTDGDIRGAILRGKSIDKKIEEITNRNPVVVREDKINEDIKGLNTRVDVQKKIPIEGSLKIPVIDKLGRVKDIIFLFSDGRSSFFSKSKVRNNKVTVKNILVLGGAGYLGSVLCRKLLNRNYKVRVLDNLTYGDAGIKELLKRKDFEFIKGDIRNLSDVVEAIKGVDAVVHLAAVVGDPACAKDPEETLEINYLATKNIIETCKYFQINRFVFASTCSVYGQSLNPDKQLSEISQLNPVSLYAETKIKCEEAVLMARDENFLPTILRMATLYGYSPLMRFDLSVNLLAAKAIFERNIPIFGGNQWRPWLHLEDAADAYIACIEKPISKTGGETFNVVSENYKVIDIGKIINKNFPTAKISVVNKTVDRRDYNVSSEKILKQIGFKYKKSITDGINDIAGAVKADIIKDYKNTIYRVYSN